MTAKGGRRHPYTPSLIRSVGLTWLLFGSFCAFGSWAFLDSLGYQSTYALLFLVVGLIGGLILVLIAALLHTPKRVVCWATLTGMLIAPPALSLFGIGGLGYFILVRHTPLVQALQWLAITFAAVLWIAVDLRDLQRRVGAKRYMEREFIEFDDRVEMRWERKTDIEAPPISNATLLGQVWNRHGLKLVLAIAPLSGAGYATSRLLDHAGGDEAVLLFLAVLGVPLCIAMLSKLACGAYLNVYKVLQVERRTGKPVLFDQIPAE